MQIVDLASPPPPGSVVLLDLKHAKRWSPEQLIAVCQLLALADSVQVTGANPRFVRQTLTAMQGYGLSVEAVPASSHSDLRDVVPVAGKSAETTARPEITFTQDGSTLTIPVVPEARRVLADLASTESITTSQALEVIDYVRAASLPVLIIRGAFDARTDLAALLSVTGQVVEADPRRTIGSAPRAHPFQRLLRDPDPSVLPQDPAGPTDAAPAVPGGGL